MRVHNAASFPIVARGFVGNILTNSFRLIMKGEMEEVLGPDFPKFGLLPYNLPGVLVVRDIGFVQIDCTETMPLLLLRRDERAVFSRIGNQGVQEGVCVACYDQAHLLGI